MADARASFSSGVSISRPPVRLYCKKGSHRVLYIRPKGPALNPKPEGVMTMPFAMQVQPHLFYEGRCEEALAFYRGALGAEVTMLIQLMDGNSIRKEMGRWR
jgi:hypothetical protein